jgi:hypothetical protein
MTQSARSSDLYDMRRFCLCGGGGGEAHCGACSVGEEHGTVVRISQSDRTVQEVPFKPRCYRHRAWTTAFCAQALLTGTEFGLWPTPTMLMLVCADNTNPQPGALVAGVWAGW